MVDNFSYEQKKAKMILFRDVLRCIVLLIKKIFFKIWSAENLEVREEILVKFGFGRM